MLIDLLRDSWLVTCEDDPIRAGEIAQDWFEIPYPTFKRLALYAASREGCFAVDKWVEWLMKDDSMWL